MKILLNMVTLFLQLMAEVRFTPKRLRFTSKAMKRQSVKIEAMLGLKYGDHPCLGE